LSLSSLPSLNFLTRTETCTMLLILTRIAAFFEHPCHYFIILQEKVMLIPCDFSVCMVQTNQPLFWQRNKSVLQLNRLTATANETESIRYLINRI
jgi:hypothetical protein